MRGEDLQKEEYILLTELKSGGKLAFNFFYQKYSLQLYRKLLKMVQIDVIAEELLQDLFMKIWEKRDQIDPALPFKAYLYRIAERIVYDYFRKLTREAKASDFISAHTSEIYDQFENGELETEMNNRVQAAISRLPEQQRLVFNLCKIEGKSYQEVSALLGITRGTINTHITRATKTIKIYLAESNHLALIISVGLFIKTLK